MTTDNPLRWNSCFFEIEENASGWYWRLRLRDHRCIAVSPRDYRSREELEADLALVPGAALAASKVKRLVSKQIERTDPSRSHHADPLEPGKEPQP